MKHISRARFQRTLIVYFAGYITCFMLVIQAVAVEDGSASRILLCGVIMFALAQILALQRLRQKMLESWDRQGKDQSWL